MQGCVRGFGIVGIAALTLGLSDAVAAPYALPPAPPLPAGCATPTKDQCVDSNWYSTNACASDKTKAPAVQDYCTWVLQKSWSETASATRPTLFPTAPPSSPFPILTPGRRIENGKPVDAVPMNRPADKRRYPGAKLRGTGRAIAGAAKPATLNFTPRTMQSGAGSYAGIHTASVVPHMAAINDQMRLQRGARVVSPLAPAVKGMVEQKPAFVPTPGAGVSSCEEYAYKRWGEWSDYTTAAKKLGTNYRQVFKIATDPTSPTFINKPNLKQSARPELIPIQVAALRDNSYWWGTSEWANPNLPKPVVDYTKADRPWQKSDSSPMTWPANVFVSHKPYWLADPKATTENGKALISGADAAKIDALVKAQWSTQYGGPRGVRAKNETLPLSLHTEMKALFDTKYGDPLDDEMADAEKRTAAYMALAARADSFQAALTCYKPSDPCFRCSSPPATGKVAMPSVLQRIADRVSGSPVINPADLGSMLQGGSVAARLRSLSTMSQIGSAMGDLYGAGAQAATGGAKQKAPPPLMQIRGGAQDEQAQCIADMMAKRPAIEEAYYDVARQLVKMDANEIAFGDRGCFADPGKDQGNLCDWSYAKFAAWSSTLFDDRVETDFQECRAQIDATMLAVPAPKPTGNLFTAILKHPVNQALTFPCTQRRDFTGSANDARWFFKISGDSSGKACEADLVNAVIEKEQAAIMGQLKGMHWKPGELTDHAADNNVLGSKGSLGAYFEYVADWDMKKTGVAKSGDPMDACKFEGSGGTNIRTGIYFFGDDIEMFKMTSNGTANGAPKVSMDARYLDIDSFTQKQFDKTPVKDKSVTPGKPYTVHLANPPINLGGIEHGFWVQIGPVPLHIKFGATATAGLDYTFEGKGGDNCADMSKPSGFAIESQLEPWVRADAYADASVDVVIAAAGVRLDLELLKLGLPIGVDARSVGKTYTFKNGMRITIDMLSGKLVAYVSFGVGPASVEEDVTIFSWDGFHTEANLWGLDKTIDDKTLRIAMASAINVEDIRCACTADGGSCCSNVSCLEPAGKQIPICANNTKHIGNKDMFCAFTKDTFGTQNLGYGPLTKMPAACTWFTLP